MEVLVFDLSGKMAHFRQYYTNSSSLSYFFPPRTVVTGMVAGMMGLLRDSYYDLFTEEVSRVALSIRSSLRKRIQTVNYVWAERLSQVNLSTGKHTQIPVEFVLPFDYRDCLVYRVFLWHKDKAQFARIGEILSEERVHFPPYFGISECLAHMHFVGWGEVEQEEFDGDMEVSSVVGVEYLKKTQCTLGLQEGGLYVKELMPFSFNAERRFHQPPREFVGEVKTGKILLRGKGSVYRVRIAGLTERIVFMED
ncbi:MAG: CRISPR-associated protein Cas5 [Atribacterota bacterium]